MNLADDPTVENLRKQAGTKVRGLLAVYRTDVAQC